jgi:hypothetical protein
MGVSAARFQADEWIGEWNLLRLTCHKLPLVKGISDLAMEEMDLGILPAAEDLAEVHLDANIFDGPPVSESMSVRQLLKKLDENVTILDLGTRLFNSKQTKSTTTWRRHVEKISKFESDRRQSVCGSTAPPTDRKFWIPKWRRLFVQITRSGQGRPEPLNRRRRGINALASHPQVGGECHNF